MKDGIAAWRKELLEQTQSVIDQCSALIENLTVKQTADALAQAIAAGDFQRNVVVGTGAQQVIYIPFNRVQELEAQLSELRTAGRRVVDARYYEGEDGWDKLKNAICELEGLVGRTE